MAKNQAPTIRFGIIGCASIAYKLVRSIGLAPNATLVAVGSRSPDKARQFLAANSLDPASVAAYGSYEEVLDDPNVDAVYMPLPSGLHVKWAVAAARKGKHVLLEKPVAPCVADLDQILTACDAAGVQFMDGTMWVHHPRTAKMKELLSDPDRFGRLTTVYSLFNYRGDGLDPNFMKGNIRVNPDLESLGCLGDAGWYSVRAILWATDYELPRTAVALHNPVNHDSGVLLACGASLAWEDGKVATFQCSLLDHIAMEVFVAGSQGFLQLSDFVIPLEESTAQFTFSSNSNFNEMATGWKLLPEKHVVPTELPQDVIMIKEFSRLVGHIRGGAKPEKKWPEISRKTQLVIDAVKASIEKGFVPVEIGK